MWSGSDHELVQGEDPELAVERLHVANTMDLPNVARMNINQSRVHIGTKFVNVTQNVVNREVVKELSCPQYTWHYMKKSTRAEKAACGVAVSALLLSIIFIVYFKVLSNSEVTDSLDKATDDWYITRQMWLSKKLNESEFLYVYDYEPLKLVIIQHSVSSDCYSVTACAAAIRNLQTYLLTKYEYDVPYNFFIGNDGRVYEGRGWRRVGAHTVGYNSCSMCIGFIGDYRDEPDGHSKVSELQVNRTMMLLEIGVKEGYLDPNFVIVGAKDLQISESPGTNLYNDMQNWEHYDGKKYNSTTTCEHIKESAK